MTRSPPGYGRKGEVMARYMLIEDRLSYVKAVQTTLHRAQVSIGQGDLTVQSHRHALAAPSTDAQFSSAELVMLDACDYDSQQEDPTASRFSALDLCERIAGLTDPPRVVVYSTSMSRPEVNIPVREYSFVRACLDHNELLSYLPQLVRGESVVGRIPPPGASDYRDLGVGPRAQVAAAYHLIRTRPDAWELVWRPTMTKAPDATREWINDRIRPLLDISTPNYKPAIEVIKRVAGLPVARSAT